MDLYSKTCNSVKNGLDNQNPSDYKYDFEFMQTGSNKK